MKNSEFIRKVAEKAKVNQTTAKEVTSAVIEVIREAVADGDELVFKGFGKFYQKQRGSRNGINPATGKKIVIPAAKLAAFKPAKDFNSQINED